MPAWEGKLVVLLPAVLDQLPRPHPPQPAVRAEVDPVLGVPREGGIVPHGDVHPVVRDTFELDSAASAAQLVTPGLGPARPELGGRVLPRVECLRNSR